jgi:hypothetical protein
VRGHPQEARIPSQSPEALARGWRDKLVDRDAAAFGRLFAPDARFVDVEHRTPDLREARPIRGRDEIVAITRAWFDSTPTFDFEIVRVLSDATAAAFLWTYEVPGTHGALALDGVTWITCGSGLIDEALVQFDSHKLLVGIGRA